MPSSPGKHISRLWQSMLGYRHHIILKLVLIFSLFVLTLLSVAAWVVPQLFPRSVISALEASPSFKPLIVLIVDSPTIYEQNHEGYYSGFEYDILTAFAKKHQMSIRFVEVKNLSEAYDMLASGRAHLAAIRLPKPEPWSPWSKFPVSHSYLTTDFSVISKKQEKITVSPDFWLTRQVAISELSSAAWLADQHGAPFQDYAKNWTFEYSIWSAFDRVARGDSDVTVTDRHTFNLVRHIFSYLTASEPVILDAQVGFIFSQHADYRLIEQINFFIDESRKNGWLPRLYEQHFGYLTRLSPQDIASFLSRTEAVLPYYMPIFKEAAKETGIDWRLIAALAYQESQWDPDAVSYTSVKGFMMLTHNTAKELGVTDRDNVQQSILAGARYLADLKARLPEGISEPERTWMALAAYNLGFRGLSAGWLLAEQKEANAIYWNELKPVLPQLPNSNLVQELGLTNARGGEAVILVERVRAFYRILCIMEPTNR